MVNEDWKRLVDEVRCWSGDQNTASNERGESKENHYCEERQVDVKRVGLDVLDFGL
jgi:hypothetical protein